MKATTFNSPFVTTALNGLTYTALVSAMLVSLTSIARAETQPSIQQPLAPAYTVTIAKPQQPMDVATTLEGLTESESQRIFVEVQRETTADLEQQLAQTIKHPLKFEL